MRLYVEDLIYLAPELTIVIAAVILTLLDLVLSKRFSRVLLAWLTIAAMVISSLFVLWFMVRLNLDSSIMQALANIFPATWFEPMQSVELLNHSYRVDDFGNLFKLFFLLGTSLIIFMSIGSLKRENIQHTGEYYYLFLPAVLGAMVMASSGDLITLFVGLELLSITTYVLVGIRKSNLQTNEAAFKYVVMGGIASAFILYGMSFLYGMTGTTNVLQINEGLFALDESFTAMIYLSFFLMLVGFGFKIAVAPFQTWAPDVYQGSPTPITGFLAIISKAAGLAIMFRIIFNVYFEVGSESMPIQQDIFLTIIVVAALSMIIGNAAALRQKNVKRLLAFSGVANAGYLLVPLGIYFKNLHFSNFSEMYFYLVAYLFMTLGMFAVLMVINRAEGHDELKGFAGLYHRAPFTAVATVILLLSLAGIPLTGGFMGKIYIILGALASHAYWIVGVMIITSIVSYYYYFGFIRQMFMRIGDEKKPIILTKPLAITIWMCTGATLILGFFPQVVIRFIEDIFSILSGDFFVF